MLQRNLSSGQRPRWQQALAEAIKDPIELLKLLELSGDTLPPYRERIPQFPLRVPRGYAARMRKGDPMDPLLRQVLPTIEEGIDVAGFSSDPVGDLESMPLPGLLHKYQGRVLLVTTGACGIHCRYCFRRQFPYSDANPAPGAWQHALDYIAADTSITEVILSGGDPLALPDSRLADLAAQLAAIPHLKRLRLHTRMPIVLPERVDTALLEWLEASRLQKIMVVHANHPNEIGPDVREALYALRERGICLLNQSVLLRGINDCGQVLAELSEALFAAGVLPYYLHMLDKVQGAAHFEVPENTAIGLLDSLQNRLPGYLVPRLVREIPGMPAKRPVHPLPVVWFNSG